MPDTGEIAIVAADLARPDHARDVVAMTQTYAVDPMGNCAPLDAAIAARLVAGLASHPTTMIWLAYDGDQAVGIATCFLGFSTFHARPLINIHDLAVAPGHRGRGIGGRLLAAVEKKARELGCCRLTLEVLEKNPARHLYTRAGFAQMGYGEDAGGSLFFAKPLGK